MAKRVPALPENKGKNKVKKADSDCARNDHIGDKSSGFAIIPTQNKGLCTLCDVNVWVVVSNGLEIKWCKGCKNFSSVGPHLVDKGPGHQVPTLSAKRQREKYALQKEEKEKARAAIMARADA